MVHKLYIHLSSHYLTVKEEIYLVGEADKPEIRYYDFEVWGVVTASIHTL